MVAGQLLTSKLITAVQAAVIVPSKERSVTQWRRELVKHTAIECDDGLQGERGPNAGIAGISLLGRSSRVTT